MASAAPDHLANGVRYVGVALQVVGVLMAALGISLVRSRFTSRPGIVGTASSAASRLWRRLRRFPATVRGALRRVFHRGGDVHLRGSADAAAATDSASITVTRSPIPPDVEGRLERLELYIDGVFEALDNVHRQIAHEAAESQARDRAAAADHERLSGELQELAGGGLRLQALGVVALVLGIIMAGVPEVVAGLLRHVADIG